MTLLHPPIWACEPNAIVCRHGHLWKHHEEKRAADLTGLSGYAYVMCKECREPTYAFGIVSVCAGRTWVSFYAISRAQWLERPTTTADETPPHAMLARYGYGPANERRAA